MRKLLPLLVSLGFIYVLLLSACGGGSAPATSATTQPTGASTTPEASKPESPGAYLAPDPYIPPAGSTTVTAATAAVPDTGQIEAPADVQKNVRTALAQKLGMAADGLTVKEATQQQWPNEALGCPDPSKSYAEGAVPGYKMVINDGQRDYTVHTTLVAAAGEPIILCENNMPQDIAQVVAAPQLDENMKKMVDMTSQDLATSLSIDAASISVFSIQPVEWPDSSLGCPKPGQNYMQVITPGYIIKLKAAEQVYQYNSDKEKAFVICDPKPVGQP